MRGVNRSNCESELRGVNHLGDDAGVVRREQEGVLFVQRALGAPHRPRRQRAREPDVAELERGAAHRLEVLLLGLDHL